ncbi:cytochrome c [Shewanella yunxiaonensis]|uniref:Cytochrome c n=1 Tax=Shewanella yunxiaonensis TaxID=2829809 RepID=A0ABX7YQE5_9GAMM|nr:MULTISPECIES: cytochrome c [Shewanella]MDF0533715.1 cytochrome c [Shewanella sp. A32]QUN04922.1 cytochrome c [Shewanella yunxiaonensis]
MRIKLTLLTSLGAVFLVSAHAGEFKKPADAIHYRQAVFEVMAHNFADIGAMVKAKKPFDKATVLMRAQNVATLSKLPLEGFIEGTSSGHTDALPVIWENKADFEAKLTAMQQNAAQLLQAAQSGDEDAVKQAFAVTGKSCKACHDLYKKD